MPTIFNFWYLGDYWELLDKTYIFVFLIRWPFYWYIYLLDLLSLKKIILIYTQNAFLCLSFLRKWLPIVGMNQITLDSNLSNIWAKIKSNLTKSIGKTRVSIFYLDLEARFVISGGKTQLLWCRICTIYNILIHWYTVTLTWHSWGQEKWLENYVGTLS